MKKTEQDVKTGRAVGLGRGLLCKRKLLGNKDAELRGLTLLGLSNSEPLGCEILMEWWEDHKAVAKDYCG